MMQIDRRKAMVATAETMFAILAVPASAFAGLFAGGEPVRPMRSKPYIEEGRPEYEEPPRPIVYPLPPKNVIVERMSGGGCLISDGYTMDENGGRWRWWRYGDRRDTA